MAVSIKYSSFSSKVYSPVSCSGGQKCALKYTFGLLFPIKSALGSLHPFTSCVIARQLSGDHAEYIPAHIEFLYREFKLLSSLGIFSSPESFSYNCLAE